MVPAESRFERVGPSASPPTDAGENTERRRSLEDRVRSRGHDPRSSVAPRLLSIDFGTGEPNGVTLVNGDSPEAPASSRVFPEMCRFPEH